MLLSAYSIGGLLILSTLVALISGDDDLSGVRIDTASAIKDFTTGLIVIKGNTNVVVRFFGTRLQDLKNVRVTKSRQSCSVDDSVGTVGAESLIEMSPPTAALNFKFPDYSTTYYFCFEWRHTSLASRSRSPPLSANGTTMSERIKRDATGTYLHQGSANYLSVSTAKNSWFG